MHIPHRDTHIHTVKKNNTNKITFKAVGLCVFSFFRERVGRILSVGSIVLSYLVGDTVIRVSDMSGLMCMVTDCSWGLWSTLDPKIFCDTVTLTKRNIRGRSSGRCGDFFYFPSPKVLWLMCTPRQASL